MKLGFWNRLSIVAGIVATIIFPVWMLLSKNADHARWRESSFDTCLERARVADELSGAERCLQLWRDGELGFVGWGYWREGALVTALAVIVIYLLLRGVVWTAKWVWQGRRI